LKVLDQLIKALCDALPCYKDLHKATCKVDFYGVCEQFWYDFTSDLWVPAGA